MEVLIFLHETLNFTQNYVLNTIKSQVFIKIEIHMTKNDVISFHDNLIIAPKPSKFYGGCLCWSYNLVCPPLFMIEVDVSLTSFVWDAVVIKGI